MPRITRRQAQSWLSPMRAALRQIADTGEAETMQGYAVTSLHHSDDYARVDFCIAGFRALMARLWLDLDCAPLHKLEKRFAAGVMIERDEFHRSLDMDSYAMLDMNERDSEAYIADLVHRRQIAHERDLAS